MNRPRHFMHHRHSHVAANFLTGLLLLMNAWYAPRKWYRAAQSASSTVRRRTPLHSMHPLIPCSRQIPPLLLALWQLGHGHDWVNDRFFFVMVVL